MFKILLFLLLLFLQNSFIYISKKKKTIRLHSQK